MEESDDVERIKEDTSDSTDNDSQIEQQEIDQSNKPVAEPVSEPKNIETSIEDYLPTELTEEDEKALTVGLPNVNCVEKIIICLDLCAEMEKETFRSRAGDKFSQIQVLIKALRLFLNSKSKINFEHEFALLVLDDGATWVNDFTNNPRDIITLLENLTCSNIPVQDTFNIADVFDIIEEKVDLPTVDDIILPPPYIVRILFIYGRSNCLLNLTNSESQRILESSPYIFFDSLYIHEPLAEENCCEEIFQQLCNLDKKGYSYIFEVTKNPTKLYVYMAHLLAHPLQRVTQQAAAFKLRPLTPELVDKAVANLPPT